MAGAGLSEVLRAVTSLARTGWMLRGVPPSEAETVASHSFAAAVIAFELAVELKARGVEVDPYRASALALLHDLAESVVGDITRRAGIGEAKREAEARAYMSLGVSDEAKRLYMEFEEGSTVESLVARAAELAATYWRSREYMCRGFQVGEIASSTLGEARRIASKAGFSEALEALIARLEPGCGGEGWRG